MTLKSASRYSHYWSGLAGTSSGGLISKCYNAGNISISAGSDCSGGYSASGITYDRATINNCYNTGNITSNVSYYYYADNAYAFGISRYGTVSKCYNIGTISAFADNTYAIAPKGTDCYFLVGKGKDAAGIKSLTPAQMKKQFMYIGFDFDNTWFIADDESYPYPQLRSNPQGQYELTGLELEDAEIDVGESKALQLECVPDYATVLRKITWTSSDESVATVDDNGTVTAVKRGEATITATAENGISATCTVKVLVPITELSFGSESITVSVGTTQKLGFTVLPADTTDTYEFTSSDPETVSVDASGNITAKKVGTAEITVTSSRGLSASCTVTVNNPATSVTLSESIKKLFAGKSFTLSARVYPDGTTDALTWSSSDNEVAVVDQNGVVTAVSAGKANITATADSGASASCEVPVESDINKTTIVMEYQETQYDGTEKKPAVTVYYNGALLIEDDDYSLTYENNTNAGEASVTIASLHDESEVVRKFNINPLSVRALSLLFHSSMVYTGSPLNAIEEITYQSLLLTEGTDYTLEYKDNTNAGTASVTVTGMGNFIGTMTKSFTILPKPIDETTVVLDSSVFMYDGTEKTPTVTVMDGERVLEAGTDYRLTYSDNISAGNASVTVEGVDNYAGSKTVNFRIEPKSILDAKVTLHSTVLAYDGTEKRPEVRVEDNGVVLTKDVDYYLDYKNNVEAGTASVNVVGMGSYYGTIATEFEIIKIGDVNMNGQVEIQDVTVLQRHLAEFVNADGSPIIDEADEEMLKIADVNRDGIVTIFDVTTIQRYLAEMIDL